MASYRRNRDYSKQFAWTHELNEDLYKCYRKAKEDPSIGYINRLKNYWDKIYPQFSYLSSKRLRDQALFSPYSQPIRIDNSNFAWLYWLAKHEIHIFWFTLQ